jgi:pyruvate dehydrogenase E1 component
MQGAQMPEDQDPQETQEWRDALDSVVDFDGPDRAAFLLKELNEEASRHAVPVPYSATTPYINTIPVDKQPPHRVISRWSTSSGR